MIKLLTVIGARPQIIKSAAISRAIKSSFSKVLEEVVVHTGQHYDTNMSQIFIEQLGVTQPSYNLEVGSGTHAAQTARMLHELEEVMVKEKPGFVLIYGDTNSTLAGTLAASKIHIPVIHVEAGLRSFNKSMPEEVNRIVCDHLSTLLFAPTETAIKNLCTEGFGKNNKPPFNPDNPGIFNSGDVMLDNSLYFSQLAERESSILQDLKIKPDDYVLCTIHRNNNSDDPERLSAIFDAIYAITEQWQVHLVLPIHPRIAKMLNTNLNASLLNKVTSSRLIHLIDPVSFFDMIMLEKNARLIMTDSGGVQKEAYFFNKPCIVLRSETEWVEIIQHNAGIIADAGRDKILSAFDYFSKENKAEFLPVFGNGRASEYICDTIIKTA